ncbi:Hypothetical predicted protein [Olea europaea subsp. europaea]|uniref:Uncharacterized protein n=1 Tax=Olea europaea subsp. europaea TaxID=158383 RepID=A0A8S0R351_OLEEU|nr:Hypothetical predicted protein [Olea europaea subsp. europaea]
MQVEEVISFLNIKICKHHLYLLKLHYVWYFILIIYCSLWQFCYFLYPFSTFRPLIAFVENCILKVGIHSFQQVIKPIMDDSIQKVSADNASPDEDLNDNPVYTGTEIKGKEGLAILWRLSLIL